VKNWKVLLAGLVSSKETGETAALNGGKETEQTKNIMVLQFTTRRELHTKDHGPDWFRRICSTEIS